MQSSEQVPNAFMQMIAIAASGASGRTAKITRDIDWPAVVRYAQEQAVLPFLGCALLKNPEIECPEELREQLLNVMRGQSSANLVRKQRIFNMIHELEELGVDVKLIKGYAVGTCYEYPECRGATDTDLLVPVAQERQVCSYMRDKGFRVDPRSLVGHHSVCQHPKLGMVEVHVHLYDEIVQEAWFQNVKTDKLLKEEPLRVSTHDTSYSALGYTDHLIFLTLHAVKHFINSGMGLRMMIDMALFWSKYHDQIDAKRYWQLLSELHFAKLVSSLLWSMIDTGCFQPDEFNGIGKRDDAAISLLLTDLELGGHMGVKEQNRYFDWFEFSRQALLRTKTPAQYRMYMIKHKIRAAYTQMFPAKEQLLRLYPTLEKHKWMTPICCVHRMFAYPIQKIRAGALREQIRNDDTAMPEEAKRRVEMFKSLGMI